MKDADLVDVLRRLRRVRNGFIFQLTSVAPSSETQRRQRSGCKPDICRSHDYAVPRRKRSSQAGRKPNMRHGDSSSRPCFTPDRKQEDT